VVDQREADFISSRYARTSTRNPQLVTRNL
jgi:hypothetical protein